MSIITQISELEVGKSYIFNKAYELGQGDILSDMNDILIYSGSTKQGTIGTIPKGTRGIVIGTDYGVGMKLTIDDVAYELSFYNKNNQLNLVEEVTTPNPTGVNNSNVGGRRRRNTRSRNKRSLNKRSRNKRSRHTRSRRS